MFSRARVILFFVAVLFVPVSRIYATSDRAYQDYLYQSDVYRQKYTDFQIAKNEYLKFKTLASETDTITKTRAMLSQRSLLLRAYLLLLNEKINETKELLPTEIELYRTYISSEVAFLENHSQFVNSVQSIVDATKASQQLEDHYVILATSMRQITLGIKMAKLRGLGIEYSQAMTNVKPILDLVKGEVSLDKQAALDRWFTQISNKRTIFLQKLQSISDTITSLKGTNIEAIETKSTRVQNELGQTQQELVEGLSYIRELITALKYKQ